MNIENIPVITDREELYDKCENMEQLFDKYYLSLLDKHYSKVYELQQENKKYKEVIDKLKRYINGCLEVTPNEDRSVTDNILDNEFKYLLKILKEVSDE